MLFLWLRAALQDPPRRKTCLTYAVTLLIAQIGWVSLVLAGPEWGTVMLVMITTPKARGPRQCRNVRAASTVTCVRTRNRASSFGTIGQFAMQEVASACYFYPASGPACGQADDQ